MKYNSIIQLASYASPKSNGPIANISGLYAIVAFPPNAPHDYLLSTRSTCIAPYANTMNKPENMASPTASFQNANESNPKVLRMVAPGTSISNPNLTKLLVVLLDKGRL